MTNLPGWIISAKRRKTVFLRALSTLWTTGPTRLRGPDLVR